MYHRYDLRFSEHLFRPGKIPPDCRQLDFYVKVGHKKRGKHPNQVIITITRGKSSTRIEKKKHLFHFLTIRLSQDNFKAKPIISVGRRKIKIIFQIAEADSESAWQAMNIAMACLEEVKDKIRAEIPAFLES